jgi:hypothetical protein
MTRGVTQDLEPDLPVAASIRFETGLNPGAEVSVVLVYGFGSSVEKVVFKGIRVGG